MSLKAETYVSKLVLVRPTHHVVWSLAGVSEGDVLGNDAVEHHLHVVPHVGVPVLVDGETGRRVKKLDVHQTNTELRQLRKLQTGEQLEINLVTQKG